MNTFGRIFRLTTFGESHGPYIGGIIDGCPSGTGIDFEKINTMVARRKPGKSSFVSQRKEEDEVEFLSGIYNGETTGAPIAFKIQNENQRTRDYDHLQDLYRPSHADYTWESKYGNRDFRGGGRSSARETVCRVVAGAVALQALQSKGMNICAYISQIGPVIYDGIGFIDPVKVYQSPVYCPDPESSEKMMDYLGKIVLENDSVGGRVTCICTDVPVGLGEPVYDKLSARLAYAMMSINAAHGFELGSGFKSASMKGSDHNDPFMMSDHKIKTQKNDSGGIQGGISNGENIVVRVAFKPTSSISIEQHTVNKAGEEVDFTIHGRHDPCVALRAVPVVEATAALTLLDFVLLNRLSRW